MFKNNKKKEMKRLLKENNFNIPEDVESAINISTKLKFNSYEMDTLIEISKDNSLEFRKQYEEFLNFKLF